MKLKWDEEKKQFVNAETGEVFKTADGETIEIEGMKTQADIQAAINAKTKKHGEELDTLKNALAEAKSNSKSSAEQIQSLQNMVSAKEKEISEARKSAEAQSAAELSRLRSENEKAVRARDDATKALHSELITNAILSQSNVEGQKFLVPSQVVALMRNSAKVVDKKDEKGEPLLENGLPVREVLFEMEVDELDPVTNKPTGKKSRDFLPVDRAVKEFVKTNPNLIEGSNTGGSGNRGSQQPGDKSLYSRDQLENMTTDEVNQNWDKVQESLAALG